MGKLKAPTTDYTPGTLPPDHRLVILGPPQGSGNYLCTDPEGEERLVEVGYKLKKTTIITRGALLLSLPWIPAFSPAPRVVLSHFFGCASGSMSKRSQLGDFAFIQLFPPSPKPISGAAGKAAAAKSKTTRLAGEIIAMISGGDMKAWKKSGEWPAGFGESKKEELIPSDVPAQSEETGGYVSDEEDNAPA